jgi:hypothetical protein|tara:strand:+ start:565 stop:735 length:171 start_codon:yes stop_codon:yes gene_type:complete
MIVAQVAIAAEVDQTVQVEFHQILYLVVSLVALIQHSIVTMTATKLQQVLHLLEAE